MASSMMTISDEAEHGNSAQTHKILIDRHTKTTQQMPQQYVSLLACLCINDNYSYFSPNTDMQNKVFI